jgi:hypothetical protein
MVQLASHKEGILSLHSAIGNELGKTKTEVADFFSSIKVANSLFVCLQEKEDKPTGNTPVKKLRPYPKSLPSPVRSFAELLENKENEPLNYL